MNTTYRVAFALALAVAALGTAAAAQSLPAPGATFRDRISVAGKNVPLPPGEWQLISQQVTSTSSNTRLFVGFLARRENDQLSGGVYIRTNLDPAANLGGWTLDPGCGRKDFYFIAVKANYAGSDQDCVIITHDAMVIGQNSEKVYVDAQSHFQRNGIKLPKTALRVYFRFANTADLLLVNYYFNPELDGHKPPKETVWATNDWHASRVSSDPKKVAYLEALKSWAMQWHDRVQSGFKGR